MNDVKECLAFASVCSYIQLFSEELDINLTFPQILNFLLRFGLSATTENNNTLVDSEDVANGSHEKPNTDASSHPANPHRRPSINGNSAHHPVSPSSKPWVMLHLRLLNKLKLRSTTERWEMGLYRFLCQYSLEDSLELQSHGYAHLPATTRTRILKYLLEAQFDEHPKFKEKVNAMEPSKLRTAALGTDVRGFAYWLFVDGDMNLLLYRKDPDEEERLQVMAESVESMRDLLQQLQELAAKPLPEVWKELESSFHAAYEKWADVLEVNGDLVRPNGPLCDNGDFKWNHVHPSEVGVKVEATTVAEKANNSHPVKKETTKEVTPDSSKVKVKTEPVEKKANGGASDSEEDMPLSMIVEKKSPPPSRPDAPEAATSDSPSKINDSLEGVRRSTRARKPVAHFKITPESTAHNSKRDKSKEDSVKQNGTHKDKHKDHKKAKRKRSKEEEHTKDSGKSKSKKHRHSSPEEKKKKHERKKSKKSKGKEVEEDTNQEEEKGKKSRRKRTGANPWECESSEEEHDAEAEEECFQHLEESSSGGSLLDQTDKWNDAPESDFELPPSDYDSDQDAAYDPKLRGRNYVRQKSRRRSKKAVVEKRSEENVEEDTTVCQVCGGVKLPEWILLCDECNAGYHTLCLRPPALLIPEGDWFCPPCQHKRLMQSLEEKIKELTDNIGRGMAQKRMQARLNFVNISINNIIITSGRKRESGADTEGFYHESSFSSASSENNGSIHSLDPEEGHGRRRASTARRKSYVEESDSSGSQGSLSGSSRSRSASSSSSSSEGRPPVRQTRLKREVNYRFDEYEEAIKEAIGEVEKIRPMTLPEEEKPASEVKEVVKTEAADVEKLVNSAKEEEDEDDDGDGEGDPWRPTVLPRGRRKRLTDSDIEEANDKDDSDFKPDEEDDEEEEEEDDVRGFIREDSEESDLGVKRHHRRTRVSRHRPSGHHRHHKSESRRRRGGGGRHGEGYEEEESDPEWTMASGRRKRRAAAMKPVRYRVSSSDEEGGDEEDNGKSKPKKKVPKVIDDEEEGEEEHPTVASGRRRKTQDDEEYAPSESEEEEVRPKKKSGATNSKQAVHSKRRKSSSGGESSELDEEDKEVINGRLKKIRRLEQLKQEKMRRQGLAEKQKLVDMKSNKLQRARNVIHSDDDGEEDESEEEDEEKLIKNAPRKFMAAEPSLLRDEDEEAAVTPPPQMVKMEETAGSDELDIPKEVQLSIVEALDPEEIESALNDLSQLEELA